MKMKYIFKCQTCDQYIGLSDDVLSKNGKRIPLHLKTFEPHQCENKKQSTVECSFCHEQITFSDSMISKNGKKIPLNPKTLRPHNCSERRKWWKEQYRKAKEEENKRWRDAWHNYRSGYDYESGGYDYRNQNRSSYRSEGRSQKYADILGCSLYATEAEVKEAYKSKIWELHPDRNPDIPWDVANARAAAVNDAYDHFKGSS